MYWPRDAEKKESERRNAEQRNWVKKREPRNRMREEKIYPGRPSKWTRKNLIRTRIMKPKPEERRWKKVRKGQREKSMNTNRINSNYVNVGVMYSLRGRMYNLHIYFYK